MCLFHNWKPEAFSYTLCHPAYQVQKLNVGCKNSKMHVGDKTCILEVQVLLYIHTQLYFKLNYRVEIKLNMYWSKKIAEQ